MTVDPAIMGALYNKLGMSSRKAMPTPMPEETIPIPEGLTPPGTPSVPTSEPRPERSMMERIGQFIPPELRELGRSIGSTGIAQEFKEAPIETTLEFVGPGADVKVMKESSARVLPRLREGDITGGLADLGIAAASIPMMAIPGSLAWHSGPRKWTPEPEYPHGRPDLSKAGTGEGHFMKGWGFYSGEAKGTGQAYRDKFKKIIPRKARGTFKGTGEGAEAPLYKMDIPDEDISNLLDWEKTLDQQPPKVQEALLNVDPEIQRGIDTIQTLDGTYGVWNELLDGEIPIWEIDEQGIKRLSSIHTGGSLYETLAKTDAHQALPAELPGSSWYKPDTFEKKHTSLWLKSLGIPGLKYLDQFSRKTDPRALGGVSAKEGATHNYVIWDQDVLNRTKMLERSGEKLATETEKLVPVFPKPKKKQGGSIMERNPYTYKMRAI